MTESEALWTDGSKVNMRTAINVLYEAFKKYEKGILGLKENWNGEGGKKYKRETWNRATNFLGELLPKLWVDNVKIPVPVLLPGPLGSVDIDWETKSFELLINIPENPAELVNLYGEGPHNQQIELTIDYNELIPVLLPWMKLLPLNGK